MDVLGGHLVYQFGPLRMWPERGLIHIEDERDNSYEVVSVRTALLRMEALSGMISNSREAMRRKKSMDPAEHDRIQRMLEAMIDVTSVAKEQGMPEDASARRDLVRRRPKSVLMPSARSSM
jgi:hypothetical protein